MPDPRDVAALKAAMNAVPSSVRYCDLPAAILSQGPYRLVPEATWQQMTGHRVRSGTPHDCAVLDCAHVGDDYWNLIDRMAAERD